MSLFSLFQLSSSSSIASSHLRIPSVVHGRCESRRLMPVTHKKNSFAFWHLGGLLKRSS